MRHLIILIILIGWISFSCQNQAKTSSSKEEKIKIELNDLNDEHPNKTQMLWLVNNYEEAFIADDNNGKTLEHDDLIQKAYFFHSKMSQVSVILIFCKNQPDALTVGETNFSSNEENQKYGVNGAVLFVVKGKDTEKVNQVLSWFSGEE
ncbi:MAG: hypothetical protein CVU05_05950 [Bacteroidetes bacterium HGW-Bacteroidetes-21]|jgi:hypothetical protein|nr:MAG: hypothetical protein CVU05_05950 [Bacteroidetes bacterium HGW-Bacteroidetes-21]